MILANLYSDNSLKLVSKNSNDKNFAVLEADKIQKVGVQQQGQGALQCSKIFPTVALQKRQGMQSENRCRMCDHCYIQTLNLEDYMNTEYHTSTIKLGSQWWV